MTARDDFDPLAPQREAAFFYGLFLRGHRVEDLRQDIDVPRNMLDKWLRAPDFEMTFRESLQRVPTIDPLRGSKAHVAALIDRCDTAEELFRALTR